MKKVTDGCTLNNQERELMERCLTQGTAPDELQRARIAALIRKWATGGKLNFDEQREIGAFIPDGRVVLQRITKENYAKSYRHYAKVFLDAGMKGKNVDDVIRNLKRWVSVGRSKTPPDLPPFDDLHQLAEWWARCMKWRVPDWLEDVHDLRPGNTEAKAPAEPGAPSDGKPAAGESDGPQETLTEIDVDANVSSDVGVKYFGAIVSDTFKRIQDARRMQNHRLVAQLTKELASQVEILRRQEAAAIKIQEGKGEILRARVVNSELVRVMTINAQSFENVLLAVLEKHAPQILPDDRREIAMRYRDECFDHLSRTSFAEPWEQSKQNLSAA